MVHREMFLMIHPLCVRRASEYFETPTEWFMQRKKKKKTVLTAITLFKEMTV